MMSYPEFFGSPNEDVIDFLERMELACISNHVVNEKHVLRLLEIHLKGDARLWAAYCQKHDMSWASWQNVLLCYGLH